MKLKEIVKNWAELDSLHGVNAVVSFLTGDKEWETELEAISAKELAIIHHQLINPENADFEGRQNFIDLIVGRQNLKSIENNSNNNKSIVALQTNNKPAGKEKLLQETLEIISGLTLSSNPVSDQKNITVPQVEVKAISTDTIAGFLDCLNFLNLPSTSIFQIVVDQQKAALQKNPNAELASLEFRCLDALNKAFISDKNIPIIFPNGLKKFDLMKKLATVILRVKAKAVSNLGTEVADQKIAPVTDVTSADNKVTSSSNFFRN